ncbi:MAG: site-2 protease family protein [Oscillospiraceae bacterium]|nr:site-2 protease family protein [Oscillospiraceae bacterium]
MDLTDFIFNTLISLLVLFTCIPVHECAHALVADKLGDPTPRNQGRITLNPFAHLTLWGSIMLVFVGFGWGKPVSVNPNNFKHPKRDMALTALAGPASNLLLAFLAMIVYKVVLFTVYYSSDVSLSYYLTIVFYLVVVLNISLAVFNFIPIPPLDGAKIFGAVIPEKIYFSIMRYEQFIIVAVLVLIYTGILDGPRKFIEDGIYNVMDFLTGWVNLLLGKLMV